MTDWYLNPIFESWLLIAVIALGLASLLAVAIFARTISRPRAIVLTVLRATAIAALMAILLQPTWVVSKHVRQSATLVVIADTSRSMLVPDMRDGKTRWEILQKALATAWPELAKLSEDVEVKFYTFDSTVREQAFDRTKPSLPGKPEGNESAIGAALDDVLRAEGRKRLIGVVLLSDGMQQSTQRTRAPQDVARRMLELGYPLYTVAVGGDPGGAYARDVAVRSLTAGPTAYVQNELAVHGELEIDGYGRDEIAVELLFGESGEMKIVDQTKVRIAGDERRVSVDLSFIPKVPGEHKLMLRAATQAGELVTTNNERSTFVTVLKGGLKVLYVEGALRPESPYLRRSLQASPDLTVDFMFIDSRDRKRWPVDLAEKFQPGKYDVYIIGDLDSDAFKTSGTTPEQAYPQLETLRGTIEKRAGLLMLGGRHSFGGGGYQHTPLAGPLPLQMDRLERQNFDEPLRKDLHHLSPQRMRPATPLGLNHSVMRLAAGSRNVDTWNQLPPLAEGANQFRPAAIKPSGRILAESPDGNPLLVAADYGSGRVLAFAGDSTWRWVQKGFDSQHKRFWRQAILWLAHKEDDDQNVWVKLDSRRTMPGQQNSFTAGARSAIGDPIGGAQFEAKLITPDGKTQNVRLTQQGDAVAGTVLETDHPGDYRVEVTATSEGKLLGTASAKFLVDKQDLELDNAAADPGLLASLAKTTESWGGQALFPEDLPILLARLKDAPKELDVEIETRWTFGGQTSDAAGLLLVVVALFGVEWFLRKKWGLV
jgi:uncharacterized membrane protein